MFGVGEEAGSEHFAAAGAADDVVDRHEVADRDLPGRRGGFADGEAQPRAEQAADHPRHRPERPHRHADQRNARLVVGLGGRREQPQHVGAVARHDLHHRHVGAEPLRLEEPVDEVVEPRRVAEVVVGQDEPDLVPPRALAHAAQVLGVVVRLEIDEVDEPARRHGVVELDDRLVADRDPLATPALRAAGEYDGTLADDAPQRPRRLDHGAGVADRVEEIDAPLDEVGLLPEDVGGFREHALAGPADQRRAQQRGFAAQLPAARIDRLDVLLHAMRSDHWAATARRFPAAARPERRLSRAPFSPGCSAR